MEQKSEDAALKGKLAGAILGRLDEEHHHSNWLLQLCKKKKILQGEIKRVMWKDREVREGGTDVSHIKDGHCVSQKNETQTVSKRGSK